MIKKIHKTVMMRSVMKHKPFWGILQGKKKDFSQNQAEIY